MILYECLDLAPSASQRQIEVAYETKIASLQGSRLTRLLSQIFPLHYPYEYAFRVLSDPVSRSEYDRNPASYDSITWHYMGF
jgi:hypothetical protein